MVKNPNVDGVNGSSKVYGLPPGIQNTMVGAKTVTVGITPTGQAIIAPGPGVMKSNGEDNLSADMGLFDGSGGFIPNQNAFDFDTNDLIQNPGQNLHEIAVLGIGAALVYYLATRR